MTLRRARCDLKIHGVGEFFSLTHVFYKAFQQVSGDLPTQKAHARHAVITKGCLVPG